MCNFNMLSYIFPEILPFLFDSSERGEWDSFILVIIYFHFLPSLLTPVPVLRRLTFCIITNCGNADHHEVPHLRYLNPNPVQFPLF